MNMTVVPATGGGSRLKNFELSPRRTSGSEILRLLSSEFAIVARQLFRMTLPVSASASCSSSMISSSERSLADDGSHELEAPFFREDQ